MDIDIPTLQRGVPAPAPGVAAADTQRDREQPPEPGPPLSLAVLFEAEESRLLTFALGLVRQHQVAEDLVQEVFLRLHRTQDNVTHPRAWLYRSLRNLALNHLRDRRIELELHPDAHPAGPHVPADSLAQLEAVGAMRRLIAELPLPEQELVRLKYIEGLKYEQIAGRTGLSIGHVGYKLHHVLKHLADALRRAGIEGSQG